MRFTRLITALLAALVVLGASLSIGSAAQAAEPAAKAARSPHIVKNLQAGEYGQTGKFYVKGAVITYKNRFVKLQKKTCKSCAYKPFKQQRTKSNGRFQIGFDGNVGDCFRIYVPATKVRKATYRVAGCIIRG